MKKIKNGRVRLAIATTEKKTGKNQQNCNHCVFLGGFVNA